MMPIALDKWLRTFVFNAGGRAVTREQVGDRPAAAADAGAGAWTCVGHRDGLTPGHFRVRLRYPSPDEARRALATASLQIENGVAVAHIDVPVVHRGHDWEHENRPPEIRWEW
jgi:hypothetical protein